MKIKRLQDDAAAHELWDRFVVDSDNGTVFQRLDFLRYHPADRFHSHHLTATKRQRLFAVIPAAIREEPDGPALISHPGASYGGIVIPSMFRFGDATALIEVLLDYARHAKFRRLDLTLTPTPYLRHPHQTLEFALVRAGFSYRKREYTNIVSLETPPEEVLRKLPGKTPADVRQAMKLGLRVTWSDDPADEELSILYRMLLENRKDLGLTSPPTHTLEELIHIRNSMPGLLTLGMTYAGNRPVASTLVFRCNSQALLTFYICHERTARDQHPVHLLLYDLICTGTRQGYRIVDFGISTVDMAPLRTLIRFKESFRAQGFFRETFEIVL